MAEFGPHPVDLGVAERSTDSTESRATVLTESNRPPLPYAPWWWGTNPNGKATVFSGGGLGFNTQSYQVYDPDKELLYVYCEWD